MEEDVWKELLHPESDHEGAYIEDKRQCAEDDRGEDEKSESLTVWRHQINHQGPCPDQTPV